MDDDNEPRRRDDVVDALVRQPLDPLSVDELHARVAALEGEIERVQARIAFATNHKSVADALFKKG